MRYSQEMESVLPEYDDLLRQYRELQQRVTRFSSVEQDLINTRDRLDHELIAYKRLHTFTERALEDIASGRLHALIAESIVDIFEVESSVILVRNLNDDSLQLETEGLSFSGLTDGSFARALMSWSAGRPLNRVSLVGEVDFSGIDEFCRLSRAMTGHFQDKTLGYEVLIMGAVSKESDMTYPAFTTRGQTMFGIFLKQLESIFSNRMRSEELKKTNAELDSFVYSVSHDLRAPLLSIEGIIEMVRTVENMPHEAFDLLEMADSAVHRLDGNIKEILEYSRNARLSIKMQTFRLRDLVNEVFDSLRFTAGQHVGFRFESDGQELIRTDRARLQVLLSNIIVNSVKYRKKDIGDPYVHVLFSASAGWYTIRIEDNGEGIPRESRERVFDMFYRASASTSGTGLGLYICREIASKLNGTISLESSEGVGTVVSIFLPVETADSSDQQAS